MSLSLIRIIATRLAGSGAEGLALAAEIVSDLREAGHEELARQLLHIVRYDGNTKAIACYACPRCGRTYKTELEAAECCELRACEKCGTLKRVSRLCVKCQQLAREASIRRWLDDAQEIDERDAYMLTDGDGNWWGSVEDYCEDIPDVDRMPYLFASRPDPLQIDVSDILESALERWAGDERDIGWTDLPGASDLENAVSRFNAANSETVVYKCDWNRKVAVWQ